MKFFIVLALAAAVAADVSHLHHSGGGSEADAYVVSQDSDVAPESYNYNYQTSNGISGQESGQVKNVGREDEAIEVQGSNQYTAPDGTPIQTSYVANEYGYQPQGAHLPTPPPPEPIPEYIQRALKYIADHPPPPEKPTNYRPF